MSISLLAELSFKEAITEKIVNDLRQYIASKFPDYSTQQTSAIFADALKKIIDSHLPDIETSRKEKIKLDLFKQSVHKRPFSIDYSDILKTTLKFRFLGGSFFNEITRWMNHALDQEIKKEKIFEFILNVYKTQDETYDAEISTIIDKVEKEHGFILAREIPKPELGSNSRIQEDAQEAVNIMDTITLFDRDDIEYVASDLHSNELQSILVEGINDIHEIEGYKSNAVSICDFKNIVRTICSNVKETIEYHSVWLNLIHKCRLPQNFRLYFPISFNKATVIFLTAITLTLVGINASTTSGYTKTEYANLTLLDYAEEKPQSIATIDLQAVTSTSTKVKKSFKMKATAYDLSVKSCGKTRSHPMYGITFSGTTAKTGRTVAVDPDVIPLGSSLKITFPEKYKHLDGVYIAEDTGSSIIGNKIDIFFGEDKVGMKTIYNKAMEFGIQSVQVDILE